MTFLRRAAACAALLLLPSLGDVAVARPMWSAPFADDDAAAAEGPPEGFQPQLSQDTGRLCVKQCPNDRAPCDPPSYKSADGRCATQWN